jgi:hypothetical protein
MPPIFLSEQLRNTKTKRAVDPWSDRPKIAQKKKGKPP